MKMKKKKTSNLNMFIIEKKIVKLISISLRNVNIFKFIINLIYKFFLHLLVNLFVNN